MLKKLMIGLITISIIGFLSAGCGNAGKKDKDSVSISPKVSLYYLHQKKGCKTCKAIGKVTKVTTSKHFENEIKTGTLAYYDLDIGLQANDSIAKRFECTWAGLYILYKVNGKEVVEDLTDVGFMYALDKPDSLEQIIVSTITKKL